MNEQTELDRIRYVLRKAQHEVDRWDQKPASALQYLRSIKDAVDRYPGTSESAEYSLTLGAVFTAMHDPGAESYLWDARDKIGHLREEAPELEVRFHDLHAYFSENVCHNRTSALKHLELAKAAAVRLGIGELTAHQQLRLIRLDLQINNHPEQKNFSTLRRVTVSHDYTEEERLAAWHQHWADIGSELASPLHARGMQTRTEEYFLGLLRSVRVSQ